LLITASRAITSALASIAVAAASFTALSIGHGIAAIGGWAGQSHFAHHLWACSFGSRLATWAFTPGRSFTATFASLATALTAFATTLLAICTGLGRRAGLVLDGIGW
jgi:hypothetical protein